MNNIYTAHDNGYMIADGTRFFNRALYGKYYEDYGYRFKAFAGDRPGVMTYAGLDMGRLFWAIETGEGKKLVANFESVVTAYERGTIKHVLRDKIINNGTIEINIVPCITNHSFIVKVSSDNIDENVKLVSFYGFASVESNARAMDVGYYNLTNSAKEISYDAEKCDGNSFAILDKSFVMSVNDEYGREIRGYFTHSTGLGICSAELIEKGNFDIAAKHDALNICFNISDISGSCEQFITIACTRDNHFSNVDPEILHNDATEYYKSLSNRITVSSPEVHINAAMQAANVAIQGFWLDPVFAHGAWSWDIPILGWRSMYGPCLLGMHEEIRKEAYVFNGLQLNDELKVSNPETLELLKTSRFGHGFTYFGGQNDAVELDVKERINKPEADSEWELARQSPNSIIISEGRVPYMPTALNVPMYNMQTVYFDQLIYEWEQTGDIHFAKALYLPLKRHLDWEKRCFDADNDGLYENYANFWASDGVFASGGACSLASAYNFRANLSLAEMADLLNLDGSEYRERANKTKEAFHSVLWSKKLGLMAESKDILGEKMCHYSTSIPTVVHCAESGILDGFQLYQTLKYTENELEHKKTNGGELVWNTNWAPYLWSVRDVDFADSFQLAMSYFSIGQKSMGHKILMGAITESTCNHVSPGAFMCVLEGKSVDFADTTSMFVRVIVEGLYGIQTKLQRNEITIAPQFPDTWENTQIKTSNVSYEYNFDGTSETIYIECAKSVSLNVVLKAKRNKVMSVLVNGKEHDFTVLPAIGHSLITLHISDANAAKVTIEYAGERCVEREFDIFVEENEEILVSDVKVIEIYDPQDIVKAFDIGGNSCSLSVSELVKYHTVFLKVKDSELEYFVPVNIHNINVTDNLLDVYCSGESADELKMIDISDKFNDNVSDIYNHEYLSPRPETCSLQVPKHLVPSNWCWVKRDEVDGMNDRLLRKSVKDGVFKISDQLAFKQPSDGYNVSYISKWDNFPDSMEFKVDDIGEKMYVMFTGYTNQMQCGVVNAVMEVMFEDGTSDSYELVAPVNFRNIHKGPGTERICDKWCYGEENPVRIQIGHKTTEDEWENSDFFSHVGTGEAKKKDNGIYAQVGVIALKNKKAVSLKVSARANDIVIGVMGITIA